MAFQEHEVDRRTLFKAGLGATVAAVVGTELAFEGAADAVPSAEFPWIIDCDSWGARPPSSTIQITGNTTNKIILHHMAFPNVTDYSREHAIQLAKDCQNLHMDTNGWADTGQHFTVSRGGYVLEGRHRSLETLDAGEHQVIAAHCPGENGNAIGIENEGTYITETPPEALLDSLVQLCVAVCQTVRPERLGHLRPLGLLHHRLPRHRVLRAVPDGAFARAHRDGRLTQRHSGAALAGHLAVRRRPGRRGGAVPAQQRRLHLAPDGNFGFDMNAGRSPTSRRSNGIPVDPDATFDPATWEALAPVLDKHATGLPVDRAAVHARAQGLCRCYGRPARSTTTP